MLVSRLALVVAAVGIVILGNGFANARPSSTAKCSTYEAGFVRANQLASSALSQSVGDDSVYRDIDRNIKRQNALLEMQMNLSLMIHSGCSVPDYAIDADAYSESAFLCTAAMAKDPGAKDLPPACDRSRWQRSGRLRLGR